MQSCSDPGALPCPPEAHPTPQRYFSSDQPGPWFSLRLSRARNPSPQGLLPLPSHLPAKCDWLPVPSAQQGVREPLLSARLWPGQPVPGEHGGRGDRKWPRSLQLSWQPLRWIWAGLGRALIILGHKASLLSRLPLPPSGLGGPPLLLLGRILYSCRISCTSFSEHWVSVTVELKEIPPPFLGWRRREEGGRLTKGQLQSSQARPSWPPGGRASP